MADESKSLVIVESPAKARTISAFLPDNFIVEASIGHIRDLPTSAKEIPAKDKGKPWARLGIDIENDFRPLYIVPNEKKKQVSHLKKLLRDVDVLYLATDEDREGESISWHLSEVLAPKVPLRRLVFHEITEEAILEALKHPREMDVGLVKAQEARRILDRLYGYEISPILWRKIAPRLSAGRVQSVAVRLIVERERARRRFRAGEFWDLKATLETAGNESFDVTLIELDGKRLVSGKDFDSQTGELQEEARHLAYLEKDDARALVSRLEGVAWSVRSVRRKPYTTHPAPPFTTSTLQQEANRKFRFSAKRTMQTAQRLYESGHITYMRTDSTTLASSAVESIRSFIGRRYGADFLSRESRQYATTVKNAQEAHEAIRPSGVFDRPRELASVLGPDELRLYELIWKRTMACQMAQARGHRIAIRVGAEEAIFQASGKTIEFAGFLRAYAEGSDDPRAEVADQEILLPPLSEEDPLEPVLIEPKSHTTQPPARYTEASLVKELEAKGIGRPSTYASIIETILNREYVIRQDNALVPTFVAFAVINLLEKYFSELVDIDFTARLENALDKISLGERESLPYLKEFYFGDKDSKGLRALTQQDIDARESCTLRVGEDDQDRTINVRVGRYGPYVERGTERAPIPDQMPPDELSVEKAIQLLEEGSKPRELGNDPATGKGVLAKTGRFGPYVQLGDNEDSEKPRMKSLLPGMTTREITLEQALALLSLPRSLGPSPETGEEILVDYGRYGPYVRCGKETRTLDRPEDVFELSVEGAVAKLKEEKKGPRRGPQILKELGKNSQGLDIRLLSGRYGPYVSDGSINASVPRGTNPEDVDLPHAMELIRAREAAGPRKGRRATKRKTGKKRATKK